MSELSADQVDAEVLPFLSISARPDLKCIAMQVLAAAVQWLASRGVTFLPS